MRAVLLCAGGVLACLLLVGLTLVAPDASDTGYRTSDLASSNPDQCGRGCGRQGAGSAPGSAAAGVPLPSPRGVVPVLGVLVHSSSRTPGHFAAFAASLETQAAHLGMVVVVANEPGFSSRSWDDVLRTVERLRQWMVQVDLVRVNDTFLGVAAAWNIISDRALRARAAWWVISACDVSYPPGSVSSAAAYLSERERAVGGMKALFHFTYSTERAAQWNAFVVTEAVWRAVGRFDEVFWPAYWEDIDYKMRLRREGVPIQRIPIVLRHPDAPATHSDVLMGCRTACVSSWIGRAHLRWKWPSMNHRCGPFAEPRLPSTFLYPEQPQALRREIVRMMSGVGAAYRTLCDCSDCSHSKGHWRRRWNLGAQWQKQPMLPVDFLAATRLLGNDTADPKRIALAPSAPRPASDALLRSIAPHHSTQPRCASKEEDEG